MPDNSILSSSFQYYSEKNKPTYLNHNEIFSVITEDVAGKFP